MLLRQFPDLQWLKHQSERRFSDRRAYDGSTLAESGWPTVILNVACSQTYRDDIRGPLSLFTNLSGESEVSVNNKSTKVREGFFFLTNPDQRYTLEIDRRSPAQTFNIHFGENFIEQVFHSVASTETTMLDNHVGSKHALNFHNRLQPRTASIDVIIDSLRHESSPLQREETLYRLLVELLVQERHLKKSQQELPVLKNSTRDEVVKRLLMATDYVYTFLDRDLSLDELAAAACLSKFHFLRLFKTVFGKTPYQFINEARVMRSKELLKRSTLTVHEIARAVGFNNSSSFSRMFFQQTGFYPTSFRH